MKFARSFLFTVTLILVLMVPSATNAQQWSGVVAPSRAVDWSTAGVAGGIPVRTIICATLNPGATVAQINSAIAACPANQVVLLNAGTYNLSSGILFDSKSNVTLRGSGSASTFLVFSGSSNCWGQSADICMRSSDVNWAGGPSNTATFTGAGPWPKGTTQITLSSVSNLKVGAPLILDQLDDLSDGGAIYICEQSKTMSPNQNPPCNDDSNATGGDSGAQRGSNTASVRGQMQIVTVTAINGSTVTFSPVLYMPNWRSSQQPGGWWATSPIAGDGVENLSVDHTGSDAFVGTGIFNCLGCWVTGVRSVNSDRDHVDLFYSPRATVQSNYFYGTKNAVSQSYGVEAYGTSDSLIANNIFQKVAAPQMINADCEGCVVAYNFAINDFFAQSSNWESQSVYAHSLISNLLIEGNVGNGLYADLFHGTHNFITVFRNKYDGDEANNGSVVASHTNPLILFPYSRFFNVIGNVLGTAGYHTNYQALQGSSGNTQDVSIYVLGTGPQSCCQSGDPLVASTLMLWGNYDTVNAGVRFITSEVPSSISGNAAPYSNPVPASQALPASFYLNSKPSWWPASKPWPAIGPDVTGGNLPNVAGHANSIPAQDCYTNVMRGAADGTGSVLTFSASTCYTTVAAPAPPTNVGAIVH